MTYLRIFLSSPRLLGALPLPTLLYNNILFLLVLYITCLTCPSSYCCIRASCFPCFYCFCCFFSSSSSSYYFSCSYSSFMSHHYFFFFGGGRSAFSSYVSSSPSSLSSCNSPGQPHPNKTTKNHTLCFTGPVSALSLKPRILAKHSVMLATTNRILKNQRCPSLQNKN